MLKHIIAKPVKIYQERQQEFFNNWLESFQDLRTKIKILRYIDRLRLINHIHYQTITAHLFELHFDYNNGFYLYFTILPDKNILLLDGVEGTKKSLGTIQAKNHLEAYHANIGPHRFRDYEQLLMENLMDNDVAALYLDIALEEFIQDRNKTVFLRALRNVATLQGGLAPVSKKIKIRKQYVQQTLSPSFRPKLDLIGAVITSLGFKICIESEENTAGNI